MRFKVPQNIDMPDRIIGPLTMIQFVEAVLGGGLAYICFSSFPAPINLLFAGVIALFTLAVVFVKINERPFLFYLGAFARFVGSPKQRVWQKNTPDNFEVEIYKPAKNSGPIVATKSLSKAEIAELAKNLDSQSVDKMRIG